MNLQSTVELHYDLVKSVLIKQVITWYISDKLLLAESLPMLQPDWLDGTGITGRCGWSVKCILPKSPGSC